MSSRFGVLALLFLVIGYSSAIADRPEPPPFVPLLDRANQALGIVPPEIPAAAVKERLDAAYDILVELRDSDGEPGLIRQKQPIDELDRALLLLADMFLAGVSGEAVAAIDAEFGGAGTLSPSYLARDMRGVILRRAMLERALAYADTDLDKSSRLARGNFLLSCAEGSFGWSSPPHYRLEMERKDRLDLLRLSARDRAKVLAMVVEERHKQEQWELAIDRVTTAYPAADPQQALRKLAPGGSDYDAIVALARFSDRMPAHSRFGRYIAQAVTAEEDGEVRQRILEVARESAERHPPQVRDRLLRQLELIQ